MTNGRQTWTLLLITCAALSHSVLAADWKQFRGPNGSGLSAETNLPSAWSDTENLVWKIDLPGAGSSAPIVLAGRVYVTCFSGVDEQSGNVEQLKRHLVCIDRQEGKILWDAEVPAEQPEDPYRGQITQHGYASHTPVTDGQRIYVFFGKSGVLAFDLEGNKLWQENVGKESGRMGWGSGASPLLYKDFVIVNAAEESQSVRALDKSTGKEIWKAEGAALEQVYATPALVDLEDGTQELVVSAAGEVWGINPDSGKLSWYAVTSTQGQISPSIVARDGIAYVLSGRSGTLAIRAGGKGDVTDSHIVWSIRSGSNVPTPLLYEGHLYWIDDRSVAHCVEADTGKSVYDERLSGQRSPERGGGRRGGRSGAYASLVCADGKLYAVTRREGTFVLAAKPQYKQLAHNRFESDDAQFNATPAISNGQLFLRSDKFLYCIANGQ